MIPLYILLPYYMITYDLLILYTACGHFSSACSAPPNGQVDCGVGLVNVGLEGETCNFSCDPGYMLQGSVNGTCEGTGSWSGGLPSCEPLTCSANINATLPVGEPVVIPSCDSTYQSQCSISCDEGFTGDNVTYLCNVTSDPNIVEWVPLGGVDVMCDRGLFL